MLNDGVAGTQENNLMAAHDAEKDDQRLAANFSIYNLNGDMIQSSGLYSGGNLDVPFPPGPDELRTWNENLVFLQVTL